MRGTDEALQSRQRGRRMVRPPGVRIEWNDQEIWIAATGADAPTNLVDAWDALSRNATTTVTLRLPLDWPEQFRNDFVTLAARSSSTFVVNDKAYSTLLRAVLSLFRANLRAERLDTLIELACQTAGATPHCISDLQAVTIHKRLCSVGRPEISVARIRKRIEACCQVGSGRAFAEEFAKETGIVYYRQKFYRYDGVYKLVQEIEPYLVEFLQSRHRKQKLNTRAVADALMNLKGIARMFGSEIDMPVWRDESGRCSQSPFVACRNGLLDLSPILSGGVSPGFQDFTPRHLTDVQLGFAFDEEAECPRWMNFLREVLPKKSPGDKRREVLQEYFGYCLLGQNLRLEKMLIVHGRGSNGKSVALQLLTRLLGAANVSGLPLEQLGGEHRSSALEGKLANIVTEMDRLGRIDEGLIKAITSNEIVQINPKYKDPYDTVLTPKLVVSTNTLPSMNDRTDAAYRRLLIIPFLITIDEAVADVRLIEKLVEELPGIANWAFRGASRLSKNARFTHCEICANAVEELKLNSDPVRQFVAEACEQQKHFEIEKALLYASYKNWCSANGRYPVCSSAFRQQILAIANVSEARPGSGTMRKRKYRGISLRGPG